ncbi:unnamed protein product [Ilex paraguariensis]|uniref:Peptidase A1 domain-containing protein n=1 Tax=Ilex paraguariensis TaxID=185542 RepID=A0ABC8SZ84_9AQUA
MRRGVGPASLRPRNDAANFGTQIECRATTMITASTITTKLVHRDSVLPQSRPIVSFPDDDIRGSVIPEYRGSTFFVNLSIGDPPVPQLLTMDTGSSLTWVHCQPCSECYPPTRTTPIFDPLKSSTYNDISCYVNYCDSNINGICDSTDQCNYSIKYADRTTSVGDLGTEKLSFVTSTDDLIDVSNVVFGCGHKYNAGNGALTNGVLGLGFQKISLVSKLSSKFSYCLGDIGDHHYIYNQLILGDGAIIEGDSTPLELYDGHYYITLESIRVGETLLGIDPNIFKRTSSTDGVVIDSGATLMYLRRAAYEQLKSEIQNLIGGLLPQINGQDLCYLGILNKDLKGFPVVTLNLAGGADLVLDITSMFRQQRNGLVCMAVKISEDNGIGTMSIIGVMAQQNYNVAYDLTTMKLYLQRIDCELLQN